MWGNILTHIGMHHTPCFDVALRFTYIEALAIFISFTHNFVHGTRGSACVVPSVCALPVDLKQPVSWKVFIIETLCRPAKTFRLSGPRNVIIYYYEAEIKF